MKPRATTANSQGYRIEGNAPQLAGHFANARIEGLVGWTCLGDDVHVRLARISLRVNLHDLRHSGRLHFRAVHDGPGKDRTWTRRVPGEATPKDVVALIVSDIDAIRGEFRRLE
ncbi:hypothetical protein [Streptomyces sp. NPDC054975]